MSTSTNALAAPVPAAAPAPAWAPDMVDLVRRTICVGATGEELALYLATCRRLGLDPLTRQIHAVRRWDARAAREVMTIQVGIDGLRLVAHRTGEMDGYDPPQWCGSDGQWRDVWLSDEPPAAARVTVYRRGHSHPYTAVATYAEYCQRAKDGRPMGLWARMPALMLSKVAEALALRRAFPAELAGVYEPSEIDGSADSEGSIAVGGASAAAPAAIAPPPPVQPPDRMTDRQRRQLMALCGEIGLERGERLQLASIVVGRQLGSAADLTRDESQRVIEALLQWRDDPPTPERLTTAIVAGGDDPGMVAEAEGYISISDIPPVRRWEMIRERESSYVR